MLSLKHNSKDNQNLHDKRKGSVWPQKKGMYLESPLTILYG